MTGRIKALTAGSASGFIRAENGLNVHFHPSAVLAYDVACLAVGQMVTFDLENGDCTEAINVSVHKARSSPAPVPKGQENIAIRYVGFEQKQNVRVYKFDRRSPGEETVTFVVTADLALFSKHHIAIQEGPALCLRALMTELEAASGVRSGSPCQLSEQDLLAHIARRPIQAPRRRPMPRKPTAAPNAFGQKTW